MDQDKYALVEKILKDLNSVMSRSNNILSFEIVPADVNNQNRSPVLLEEHCLGLESWCVKHVYMCCYSELFDNFYKKKLKPSILNSKRTIQLLNVTLLINPDVSTLWNKRRDLVLRQVLDKNEELNFASLVLSRKPKSNDVFSYRRWLVDLIIKDGISSRNSLAQLINEELKLCTLCSDKIANNYHSWNHRMWLINRLKNCRIDLSPILIKEQVFSEAWTSKNISDFSGYHYRQFCIKNIINNKSEDFWFSLKMPLPNLREDLVTYLKLHSKDKLVNVPAEQLISDEHFLILTLGESINNCKCSKDVLLYCSKLELLFHELFRNNDSLKFYQNHETLWYHRRFIIHELLNIMYSYFYLERRNGVLVKVPCSICYSDSMQKAKLVRYDGNNIYSSILYYVLISFENEFTKELRDHGDNYADRHRKYLKFVEKLKNVDGQ